MNELKEYPIDPIIDDCILFLDEVRKDPIREQNLLLCYSC